MTAVCFKNISKVFCGSQWALKAVDLTIPKGESFGLLGLNAAGKTTLIKMLSLLMQPTTGTIQLFKIADIAQNPTAAKKLFGVMPQDFNFSPFESINDVLRLQGQCYAMCESDIHHRTEWLLHVLDLTAYRYRPELGSLSGGVKRRVMLARALLPLPPLVILDEPSVGLDIFARQSMWKLLKALNQNGMTILLTSHYLEEVEQLCQSVAVLEGGKIVWNGKLEKILHPSGEMTRWELILEPNNFEPKTPLPAEISPKWLGERQLTIMLPSDHHLTQISEMFEQFGYDILEATKKQLSLEQWLINLKSHIGLQPGNSRHA